MSQHDFVIDNAPGLPVRLDFQAALQALASMSSGPVEPATKYPGMLWLDLSVGAQGLLRQRNQGNTAWIEPQLTGGKAPRRTLVTTLGASTFNFQADSIAYFIEGISGGAAGGGPIAGSGNGGGSGAASGVWCRSNVVAIPPSRTAAAVIGNGGTGVTGAHGNDGGQSTWTDTLNGVITLPGGYHGETVTGSTTFLLFWTPVPNTKLPSATGNFIVVGGCNSGGMGSRGSNVGPGPGASSPYGLGGGPISPGLTAAGLAAVGYGAGGSGGHTLSGTSQPGGAGSPGMWLVTEFFP